MNTHRLLIGPPGNPLYDFSNDQLRQVDLVTRTSYVMDELAYDQLNAATFAGEGYGLISNQNYDLYSSQDYQLVTEGEDLVATVPINTEMRYYVNGVLKGKFYAVPVERENRLVYDVAGVSAIGLLITQPHVGGVYNGQTFQAVAREIIGGKFPFTCSSMVANIGIYGWLPYTRDARENLHQLLFATGVMVYKDANGDVYFDFANTTLQRTINANKTYENGTIKPIEKIGTVRVTEHSYIATSTDQEYVLFDNSATVAVNNLLVTFSTAPVHDLQTTGTLQILSSGANYAVLSGAGKLTGKAYTHLQQVYSYGDDDSAILEFNDQTLVNNLNSINVAMRIANYFGTTQIADTEINGYTEKTGDLIRFTGPYKQQLSGYIKEITAVGLATVKERCSILTDYTPIPGGNNYEHQYIIDNNSSSKTWTVPAGVTSALIVLIGGGQGGGGGENGQDGKAATENAAGVGGNGGRVGRGGSAGKVFTTRISVTPGQTLTAVIGWGGTPARSYAYGSDPNIGGLGNPTTFAGHSSDEGSVPENGYINVVTGEIYATPGEAGDYAGGKGGQAVTASDETAIVVYGENVVADGRIYYGGGSEPGIPDGGVGNWQRDNAGHYWTYGGGGGAAYGRNGADGAAGYKTGLNIYGGQGGAGGSAVLVSYTLVYGKGGKGGNGGGGGGGAGGATNYNASEILFTHRDNFGAGGAGSQGGVAGRGAVIIYY